MRIKNLIPILLVILPSLIFIQSSFAYSCYANGGNICAANQGCSGTWINSDDGNGFCCLGSCYYQTSTTTTTPTTTYTTYPTTVYTTYPTTVYTTYPTTMYTTYYTTTYPQTCANQGGVYCQSGQSCSGHYTYAVDTSYCCIGSCVTPTCNLQVTVQVSPNVVQQGNLITISGYVTPIQNYQTYYPNIQISLMIDNYVVGTVYLNSNGYYSYTYTTSGLSMGGHTVTATATAPNCNSAVAYSTVTVNSNQVCTPGQTRNQYCIDSSTAQYQQCSSDGTYWKTLTNYCGTNQCSNGYCTTSACTYGQTQNYQCYSTTSYSYQYCYGSYWQTIINSCPSNNYCSGGSCYPYYPTYTTYYPTYTTYYPNYYQYNYYTGYGTLIVNVRDCNNNNYVPATVQMWPGGYSQYSSSGAVTFYGMSPGTYTMTASAPGYASQSGSQTIYYSQQTSADICLSQNAVTTTQPPGQHCLKIVGLTSDGDIKAGDSETFKASINNCGTYTENSVKTTLKMFGTSSDSTISSISPGDTQTSSMTIAAPSDAAGKEKATLQVSNSYNSLSTEKTFNVLFGQPLVAVNSLYEAKRCGISGFNFDLLNVGKAKETFSVWASGPAKDWVYFNPDTVTVDAGGNVSVNGLAAIPCSAQLGDYSFTINAKDKTTASQTTTLRVIDGRSIVGMLIYPTLTPTEIYILGLLALILILFIVIAYILWKRNGKGWYWFKRRELPGEPERMPKKSCD